VKKEAQFVYPTQRETVQRSLWLGGIALAMVCIVITEVKAAQTPIYMTSGNVLPGFIYNGPLDLPPSEWCMEGLEFEGGSLLDTTFTKMWNICPTGMPKGAFSWTGSALASDDNPSGPVAAGTFAAGGTIEIWGGVYDLFYTRLTASDNELLLRATVSGFRMEEDPYSANFLDLKGYVTLVPSDGFLVNNTIPNGMAYDGSPQLVSMSITNAQQSGGPLNNFQDAIAMNVGTEVQLFRVPEPTTILMVGLMASGMLFRRKR